VVEAFVQHSADVGIDIFRVFDALNDERNMVTSVKAIKKARKHVQLAISYSLTERKMGGPVFNLEYYIHKAKIFQDMGADSIAIKDMAGLIAPDDAFTLITVLKKVINVPLQLHTHYSSGMASMSCLKAVEAGIDILDTCVAPFALRSSHPAVEPLVVALEGTDRDTGLDLNEILKVGDYLESIAPKYKEFMNQTTLSVIDAGVLVHQIPGGMISNLVSQLKQSNALHRIKEVYEEMPRVRKDLGYPPLVTPTSQIVGTQAVQNVLVGRYKMISKQVAEYCCGLYGRPPAPINPEVMALVQKYYKKNANIIDCRPADLLKPEMDAARDSVKDFTTDIGDILIAAIYPMTGIAFLKKKYGIESAAAN